MHIEFLWFEGCPSHPQTRTLLRAALDEVGVQASVAERKVESQEQAEKLRFPGSPTIRVNGVDIDSEGASAARSALTCRTYRWADGRLQPLPELERIVAALHRAKNNGT